METDKGKFVSNLTITILKFCQKLPVVRDGAGLIRNIIKATANELTVVLSLMVLSLCSYTSTVVDVAKLMELYSFIFVS